MKILLYAVITVAVVITGSFILYRKNQNQSASTGTNQAIATITAIDNDVLMKTPTGADFSKIKEVLQIDTSTEVKTSATGRAKILLPTGTIAGIEPNSHFVVKELAANGSQTKLDLLSGGIWSKTKKILGTQNYQIQTENILASVRGTIFAVKYDGEKSTVYGLSGQISVAAIDPKTGQVIPGTEIILNGGEKTELAVSQTVQPGSKLTKSPLTQNDLRDPLIQYHLLNFIDDEDRQDPEIQRMLKETQPTTGTPLPSSQQPPDPSISPSPTAAPSPTPTPTPASTPDNKPQIISVTPKSTSNGKEFAINGKNFIVGRNTKQITSVKLGSSDLSFFIIDPQTIFATVQNIPPGMHDVILTTANNETLTLPQALEVK